MFIKEIRTCNGRNATIRKDGEKFVVQLNDKFLSIRDCSPKVLTPLFDDKGIRICDKEELESIEKSLEGVSGWFNRVFEDCM